jgi:hypothetical protein
LKRSKEGRKIHVSLPLERKEGRKEGRDVERKECGKEGTKKGRIE